MFIWDPKKATYVPRPLPKGVHSFEILGTTAMVFLVDEMGGLAKAKEVARWYAGNIRIAVLGNEGEDLSGIHGIFEGIIGKCMVNEDDLHAAVSPLVRGILDPTYEDPLPSNETQGGVTREEFEQTLRENNPHVCGTCKGSGWIDVNAGGNCEHCPECRIKYS